jgi:multidrug efflux pump subunit AcrA (membrane-fusion protein)
MNAMRRFLSRALLGRRKGLVALGLLAMVMAAGGGHARKSRASASPKTIPAPARMLVSAVRPRREILHRVIEQPGQIDAYERTALYAKIAGFVQVFHFDIGDKVQKGQLLAELWVPEVVEDLHQKEATVTEDEALIVQAQEMLRVAETKVSQAEATVVWSEATRIKAEATRAWWKSEHKRVSRLLGQGAAPAEEMEQTDEKFKTSDAGVAEAVAGMALAKAALAENKAQRAKAAADVQVAEARLRVARADRDRAAAVLGYARIEAPYNGVVSRRDLDTGAYVQAPAGAGTAATPLFEVVSTNLMRIYVDVPETDAPMIRAGGPARVLVQALGEREFPGRVSRSSWALDNRTRTLRVEIDLPNPDGILRPGMYASARIPVARAETLTLPASSVFLQDDQAWVVRLVDNKALRTPVRLGLRDRQRVEVLRKQTPSASPGAAAEWEDFADTDLIVADNPSTLADGQEVTIQSARASGLALASGR